MQINERLNDLLFFFPFFLFLHHSLAATKYIKSNILLLQQQHNNNINNNNNNYNNKHAQQSIYTLLGTALLNGTPNSALPILNKSKRRERRKKKKKNSPQSNLSKLHEYILGRRVNFPPPPPKPGSFPYTYIINELTNISS